MYDTKYEMQHTIKKPRKKSSFYPKSSIYDFDHLPSPDYNCAQLVG